MKARVKATGEIVEINESSTIYDAGMRHIYNASELENVPDTDPDYWTRLEHQYAGMAMQGMLSNAIGFNEVRKQAAEDGISNLITLIAGAAMDYATALVEKLKGESNG